MGIVLMLSAIAVLVVPSAMDSQRASQGAARLQGWLMTAQQRAVLDRAPRGIRLMPDPGGSNNQWLTQMLFIERPDDFTGGTVSSVPPGGGQPTPNQLYFTGVDLSGGNSNAFLYPVQVGDYVEVQGGGPMHLITAVTPNSVTLSGSGLPQPITTATANYRIERAARVLGEEPQEMPANIAVDLSTNTQFNSPLAANADGSVDVLFSPKGEVLGNIGAPQIIFWVHDTTQTDAFQGAPSLIAVFPRSGKIAAYEVNPDSTFTGSNGLAYPYAFVQ
jgi:hypothetical protein